MLTIFSRTFRCSQAFLQQADRLVLAQVVLWLATLISLPVLYWTSTQDFLLTGIEVGVLVQAASVLVILAHRWGTWRALAVGFTIALLALVFEALGTGIRFPFGGYFYTPRLQPQIFNVPVLIPIAWLMMLPPAWAVAYLLVGKSSRLLWAVVSAAAFTAWDFFVDPQMVAWDYWHWNLPGGYFGIPWSNFVGWFLVSFLITLVASLFFQPVSLPVTPLLVVYVFTWLLESVGLFFFWGMPGPALFGCAGMGMGLALAWFRAHRET